MIKGDATEPLLGNPLHASFRNRGGGDDGTNGTSSDGEQSMMGDHEPPLMGEEETATEQGRQTKAAVANFQFAARDRWRVKKDQQLCGASLLCLMIMVVQNAIIWNFEKHNGEPDEYGADIDRQEIEIVVWVLRGCMIALTVLALVFLAQYYRVLFRGKQREWAMAVNEGPSGVAGTATHKEYTFLGSSLFPKFLAEVSVQLIFPYPGIDHTSFEYQALQLGMFLRIYLVFRLLHTSSEAFRRRSEIRSQYQDFRRMNLKVSWDLTLKMAFYKHMWLMVTTATVVILCIMAFAVFILERGLQQSFEDYWNCLWFSFVTFTTIGYGDMVPQSYSGRLIAVLLGFMGHVVTALFGGVMTNKLTPTKTQQLVTEYLANQDAEVNYLSAAASLIQSVWRVWHEARLKRQNIFKQRQGAAFAVVAGAKIGRVEEPKAKRKDRLGSDLRANRQKVYAAVKRFRQRRYQLAKSSLQATDPVVDKKLDVLSEMMELHGELLHRLLVANDGASAFSPNSTLGQRFGRPGGARRFSSWSVPRMGKKNDTEETTFGSLSLGSPKLFPRKAALLPPFPDSPPGSPPKRDSLPPGSPPKRESLPPPPTIELPTPPTRPTENKSEPSSPIKAGDTLEPPQFPDDKMERKGSLPMNRTASGSSGDSFPALEPRCTVCTLPNPCQRHPLKVQLEHKGYKDVPELGRTSPVRRPSLYNMARPALQLKGTYTAKSPGTSPADRILPPSAKGGVDKAVRDEVSLALERALREQITRAVGEALHERRRMDEAAMTTAVAALAVTVVHLPGTSAAATENALSFTLSATAGQLTAYTFPPSPSAVKAPPVPRLCLVQNLDVEPEHVSPMSKSGSFPTLQGLEKEVNRLLRKGPPVPWSPTSSPRIDTSPLQSSRIGTPPGNDPDNPSQPQPPPPPPAPGDGQGGPLQPQPRIATDLLHPPGRATRRPPPLGDDSTSPAPSAQRQPNGGGTYELSPPPRSVLQSAAPPSHQQDTNRPSQHPSLPPSVLSRQPVPRVDTLRSRLTPPPREPGGGYPPERPPGTLRDLPPPPPRTLIQQATVRDVRPRVPCPSAEALSGRTPL